MKKIILIFSIFLLFSCGGDYDPCDKTYELNEPGGFGRNEVTFLIDGETVWYSRGSGIGSSNGMGTSSSNGGFRLIKEYLYDSLGNIILDTNLDTLFKDKVSFTVLNKQYCDENKYNNFTLELFIESSLNKFTITRFEFINSVLGDTNAAIFRQYSSSNINSYFHINYKDSIVNGNFSGTLYKMGWVDNEYKIKDSIIITDGIFDYKFKEIIERGRF